MMSKPVTALPTAPSPSPERTPSLPSAPDAPRTPPRPAARSSNIWLIAGLAVLLVTGLGAAILLPGFKNGRTDLILHKVKRETLHLTIVERGQLESANNRDIICRVRAGDKANATVIKWVVDDGSYVKAGQEVVRLDASGLE
jgi:HlyD family secretion protein